MNQPCPKCKYIGSNFNPHKKQMNPDNPFEWICGNCSEAFILKSHKQDAM